MNKKLIPKAERIRYTPAMETIDISQTEEIFTVSRLNREARFILEGSFPMVWIEGEISNFAVPSSGHWYFSLKDAAAQVRCAMFKPYNRKLGFTPKDGMHVMLKTRVSLYEGRGEFQLLAEYMEEMGEGRLRQAFEALKNKLQAAGLFAAEYKKSFPPYPRTIGVITSPTGAAIRDILSVLKRRFPAAAIIVYPTLVQGDMAASQIVAAIRTANQRQECDVLILARGGGSLEDLWPFNEEMVADAIFRSHIPLITGIGHEVDFTIADFVADQRAPTPSAAAELITPDGEELHTSLAHCTHRLQRQVQLKVIQLQQQLTWTHKQLQQQHPRHRLAEQKQNLDVAEATLLRLQKYGLQQKQAQLTMLITRLSGTTPLHQIRDYRHQLHLLHQRLTATLALQLRQKQQLLGKAAATLDALSPLATLQRGYAIATKQQQVLRSAREVASGDKINLQLPDGNLACTVDQVNSTKY